MVPGWVERSARALAAQRHAELTAIQRDALAQLVQPVPARPRWRAPLRRGGGEPSSPSSSSRWRHVGPAPIA